jgi:hypothetical protein
MSRTVRPDKGDPEPPSAIQRELATAADPTPENVLAGLVVQEKSLRELRRYLFTRLFQLQVRLAPARSPSPRRAVSVALTPPPTPPPSLERPVDAPQAEEAVLRDKLPEHRRPRSPESDDAAD